MIKKFEYIQRCGFHSHPNANKNGVILEHRLVMSQYLKRPLKKGEIIHHINGDRCDNRLTNLKITTRAVHAKKHAKHKKYIRLTCSNCGEVFFKPCSNINWKKANGQTSFYCTRKCMAHSFGRGRKKPT